MDSKANNNHKFKIRKGSSGIHFFDRMSGLNILLDEITVPQNQWSIAPRHVSIAITNLCNLHCSFCYAPKTPANLKIDDLKKWIIELDQNGCLGIGFGGGEPTLYPKLEELCSFTSTETSLAITLTTNGQLLDGFWIEKYAGIVNFLRVSMDGIGDTYEKIRGGSFENLLEGLLRLPGNIPFGVNFVVNAQTYPDLDQAISIASEVGASEFLLLPEYSSSGIGGIDSITMKLLVDWVYKYDGGIPLLISEYGAEDIITTSNPFKNESRLSAFAHIDAFGNLKKDSFVDYGVQIGNDGFLKALEYLKNNQEEN